MAQCFLHISLVLTVNQGSLGTTKTRVGEGNGNPLQYSCQENSMDGEPGRLQFKGSKRVEHD